MKEILQLLMLCTLSLLSLVPTAYSIDEVTQILAISKTKKSLVLTLGENAEIKVRDRAYLIARVRKEGRIVYLPVSKLKSIKVYPHESLWVALKHYYPAALKGKRRFFLVTESHLLKGRTELKIARTDLISHPKTLKNDLKNALEDNEDYINEKEKENFVWETPHDPEKHDNSQLSLFDLHTWELANKEGDLRSKAIFRSTDEENFRQKIKSDTFDKMVYILLKKYNDDEERARIKETHTPGKMESFKQSGQGMFARNQDKLRSQSEKERKLRYDIMAKGEAWSDEYSDDELTDIVNQMGIFSEQSRRSSLVAKHYNYQLFFQTGTNLLQNENLSDRNNTQGRKTDMAANLEYFLFKNMENMNKISLDSEIRMLQDATSIGKMNAKVYETSFTVGANWYPYTLPHTIEKNVFYMGLYFRTGYASLVVDSVGEDGRYLVGSFPGLRAGAKYNFRNSMSLKIQGSFETLGMERLSRSKDDGVLPNRSSMQDGRVTIGIGWLL